MRTRARATGAMLRGCFAAMLGLAFVAAAHAQTFPAKPVTIVVPFAAGGSTDVMMRIIGKRYSELVEQPVVIENRGGGAGAVGAVAVKNAAPNGYTLLVGSNAILAIHPVITPDPPYDPIKDFLPIQMLYDAVHFLYVPASSPANSVSELIALARKKPGGLSYASQGSGGQLGGAMLQGMSGAPFVHVPYKGSGPAMLDLSQGRVDLFFSIHAAAASFIKAGTVKVLAVCAANRLKAFPNVPTIAEAGLGSIVQSTWFALFAPAGTPEAIIKKHNEDFRKALLSPAVTKWMADSFLEQKIGTPAEIAALLASDKAMYEKAFKESGAVMEK